MTNIVDRYRDARAELYKLEHERNIKIIFACESGSRAWGFASRNSDFDVRFVYVRPARSYFRPTLGRDVIDSNDLPARTDDLDFSGWDLLKTLALAAKSNPQVVEWINSPILYYAYSPFVEELRSIMAEFNPRAMMHHYSSMAKRTWFEKLRNVGETVPYKKYLYVIRPALACFSLEANPTVMPPTDFNELLERVKLNPRVRPIIPAIRDLLRIKGDGAEEDLLARIVPLDAWIEATIPHMRAQADIAFDGQTPDMLRIDDLSVRMIREFGTI